MNVAGDCIMPLAWQSVRRGVDEPTAKDASVGCAQGKGGVSCGAEAPNAKDEPSGADETTAKDEAAETKVQV